MVVFKAYGIDNLRVKKLLYSTLVAGFAIATTARLSFRFAVLKLL